MKKVLNIMFLTLLAAVFAACSKDDATYTPIQPLEVTKADVEFDAVGGNGVITVDASSVEATCSSSWVKLSTSGNTVNVTIAENPGFDGRSARITVKSAGKQADVTVVQKGIIYGINGDLVQSFDNKARSFSLSMVHSAPVTVKSNNDWITASFDEETDLINIQLTQNNTGWERVGTVSVSSGSQSDVITISQFDKLAAMLGEYALYFNNKTADGQLTAVPAVLTETELQIEINANAKFSIPAQVDGSKGTVTLGPSGSFVGTYGKYFIYLMFLSDSGYWTGFSNVTSVSTATMEVEEYEGDTYVDFVFGGTFGNYNIDAWNLQALGAQSFAEENSLGYLYRLYYPILEKVVNVNGAAKKNTLSPFIKR